MAALKPGYAAALNNLRDAWDSMALLRETVETLAPVGAMKSGEAVCCRDAPTFSAEAFEIIRGIQAIHDAATEKAAAPKVSRGTEW